MSAAHDAPRTLLATMTNEPFQPVRLYYATSDASSVIRALEHWRGNTDATLISIIKRVIDESSVTRGDAQP